MITASADNASPSRAAINAAGCITMDLTTAGLTVFNQDEEDYSLTITSAGLDQPFKVEGQFRKAVGTTVEVKFKGGKKLIAALTAYDGDNITLKYTAKETVEGSKKKVIVEHEDSFPLDSINSVTPYISFE